MLAEEDQDIRPYQARRLKIEKDEPRIMRALDLLCHNELAKAQGRNDAVYKVSILQKWTAQFVNWENIEPELSESR